MKEEFTGESQKLEGDSAEQSKRYTYIAFNL
jgi:hypothetical protein